MKRFFVLFLISILISSCASIPKETVTLSKTIGTDLQTFHDSHSATIKMYYDKVGDNINSFINDIYSPYIIHNVLKAELDKYKKGELSLYGIIENAGKSSDKKGTEEALDIMLEFTEAANQQILAKKNELLIPLIKQKNEILSAIDRSYRNTIYANATLTAFLESARKVKESQSEALSIVGFGGLDNTITHKLVELSEFIDSAIKKSNTIDVKSDTAEKQIEEIINKVKEFTNKKQNESIY